MTDIFDAKVARQIQYNKQRHYLDRYEDPSLVRQRLLQSQQVAGQVPLSKELLQLQKKRKKKLMKKSRIKKDPIGARLKQERREAKAAREGERREPGEEEVRIVGEPRQGLDPALERRRVDIQEQVLQQARLRDIAEARRHREGIEFQRGQGLLERQARERIAAAVPPAAGPVYHPPIYPAPPAPPVYPAPPAYPAAPVYHPPAAPRIDVAPVINIPPLAGLPDYAQLERDRNRHEAERLEAQRARDVAFDQARNLNLRRSEEDREQAAALRQRAEEDFRGFMADMRGRDATLLEREAERDVLQRASGGRRATPPRAPRRGGGGSPVPLASTLERHPSVISPSPERTPGGTADPSGERRREEELREQARTGTLEQPRSRMGPTGELRGSPLQVVTPPPERDVGARQRSPRTSPRARPPPPSGFPPTPSAGPPTPETPEGGGGSSPLVGGQGGLSAAEELQRLLSVPARTPSPRRRAVAPVISAAEVIARAERGTPVSTAIARKPPKTPKQPSPSIQRALERSGVQVEGGGPSEEYPPGYGEQAMGALGTGAGMVGEGLMTGGGMAARAAGGAVQGGAQRVWEEVPSAGDVGAAVGGGVMAGGIGLARGIAAAGGALYEAAVPEPEEEGESP